MASGDRLRIADKPTLDNVNTNLGETADEGGSTTAGTAMAKLNEDLRLSDATLQEVQNLGVTINGEASPYGTGLLGDVTFNSSKFTWPTQDFYNRYVVQVKSLTIPSGQTMKPPAKCDGLYILSQGDVVIDGNIDVRGLRKTFGNVAISPTINVGDQEFELAVGGYAPKGGANGRGSQVKYSGGTAKSPCPALTIGDSISGNINGGGIGQYAIGGPSEVLDTDYNRYDYTVFNNAPGPKLAYNYNAPTALVIIAKGKITINGTILASGTNGKAPTGGWLNGLYGNIEYYCSMSGTGAIPPSGGGCVTLICNELECNGKIDTNGVKLTCSDGADYRQQVCTNGYYYDPSNADNGYIGEELGTDSTAGYITRNLINGSEGGKGGTFISTAGEIKVYTGVSE